LKTRRGPFQRHRLLRFWRSLVETQKSQKSDVAVALRNILSEAMACGRLISQGGSARSLALLDVAILSLVVEQRLSDFWRHNSSDLKSFSGLELAFCRVSILSPESRHKSSRHYSATLIANGIGVVDDAYTSVA
jgi:hypothetical protein